MARIKRKDNVEIICGKDKGKKGKVLKFYPQKKRVLVEGVNLAKKHMRPTNENRKGGILEVEMPIDVSNIMLVCPKCSKASRIGSKMLADGSKQRICKKCQEII